MTIRDNGETEGASAQRLRREEPERTEPIRSAKFHVEANGGWGESLTGRPTAKNDGGEAGDASDAVDYGVRLGYKIIEEQILKGRKLAEQWHAPDAGRRHEEQWPRVLDRLLNVYRDLGSVFMDATESVISRAANLAMESYAEGVDPHDRGERAGLDLAVTVASRKKVRIQLDLKSGVTGNLNVPALHGLDPAAEPLTSVSFLPRSTGKGAELEVEIHDNALATTYTGAIVNADTNEPMGTLCLQILD